MYLRRKIRAPREDNVETVYELRADSSPQKIHTRTRHSFLPCTFKIINLRKKPPDLYEDITLPIIISVIALYR